MTVENRDRCYLMRWYLTFAILSPKSCSTLHVLETLLRHSHVAHLGLQARSRIQLVQTSQSAAPPEPQAFMIFSTHHVRLRTKLQFHPRHFQPARMPCRPVNRRLLSRNPRQTGTFR